MKPTYHNRYRTLRAMMRAAALDYLWAMKNGFCPDKTYLAVAKNYRDMSKKWVNQ